MAAENVVATQITLGMIGAGFLQYLKSAKYLPFINENSKAINHIILLATSAAGALGIHMQWDAGAHTLVISGLSVATVAAGAWVWGKQWCVQYLVHKGAFGDVAAPGSASFVPTQPPTKPS
jgi:hypothetical protein